VKVWVISSYPISDRFDLICHVARCFNDPDILHVEGDVDPIRDIEIVNTELILADLESCESSLSKLERKAKAKEKEAT